MSHKWKTRSRSKLHGHGIEPVWCEGCQGLVYAPCLLCHPLPEMTEGLVEGAEEPRYVPTLEQIRLGSLAIQAQWDRATRRKRRVQNRQAVYLDVPVPIPIHWTPYPEN